MLERERRVSVRERETEGAGEGLLAYWGPTLQPNKS